MNLEIFRRSWILLPCSWLGIAAPAQAQMGDLEWSLHGGVAVPLATYGDYFEFGPTAGLDVGYPIGDRLGLMLGLDLDVIKGGEYYPTPTMKFFRYQLGLEADVLEDGGDTPLLLKAHVGAGATTLRSQEFWVESRPGIDAERIDGTSLTAAGGLRLGLRTDSGLIWWLGGKLNWSPLDDGDKELLRETTQNSLEPLGSAASVTITLGFNLNR